MIITLRLETPADHYTVEELTREAFWKIHWGTGQEICDEHLLVSKLRQCPSFVPELNYVAEVDGRIAGHIIYTKSYVEDDAGNRQETLTFGPISVLPELQNRGIGKALMRHTFAEAKRLGYRAVIIFGHPDYYPRVGFRRAAEFGITTSDGKTFDPFMAYPLYAGALDGICGRYFIDPVYDQLTQEETLAFDKKFPPKEKHIHSPVGVLLDRLEPDARKAIEGLNCNSLTFMKTKSERDIAALPGMDAKAVETVRAVMAEHGMRWGEK